MNADELIVCDRTRVVEYQRCHRARWWAYEYGRRGFAPVRISIALVKGSAFHAGAAELASQVMQRDLRGTTGALVGNSIDRAVAAAHAEFDRIVRSRGDLEQLDHADELHRDRDQMFLEERQVVGAMVHVYGRRVLPALLQRSRMVQVEREHVAPLGKHARIWPEAVGHGRHFQVPAQVPIQFMSRPDAVLLARDGDIETLSLKTTAAWDDRKQRQAEHDVQNLSEPWAVNIWLADAWHQVRDAATDDSDATGIPAELLALLRASPYPPTVAATRMVFVLGGERREIEPGRWGSVSPLVRGYRRSLGGLRREYAWSAYWRCTEPHPMRKSKWYPDGQCPGDGHRHKLPDDFEPFAVSDDETLGGVADWIDRLDRGLVQPEAGDALAQQIVVLPPTMRHQSDSDRWYRQVSAQEARVAEHSWQANKLLDAGRFDQVEQFLDERFPMHTAACDYPGRCPFQELCWNPEAMRDPLATGLYIIRPAHHELERRQQQREAERRAA